MEARTAHLTAIGFGIVALAGCGGAGGGGAGAGDPAKQAQQVEKQSPQVVRNWLTAAVNQDAKQYCQLMTLDLKEQTTGAQSDQASRKCQQVAKSPGTADLPARFLVVAEEDEGSTEKVQITSKVPESVEMVKEGGSLKIDQVSGGPSGGEGLGERVKPSPAGKQAETVVKQWILAGVQQDSKRYCQQLTVRYREELANARSDQAAKKCERLVVSGNGDRLPLAVETKVTSAEPQSAEATIQSSVPATVELRKEGGSFKVDGEGESDGARKAKKSDAGR